MTVVKRETQNLSAEAPLMVRESEAARYLGVSLSYLRKARCDGVLKHQTPAPAFVKIGSSIFYRMTDLHAWVDALASQEVTVEGRA